MAITLPNTGLQCPEIGDNNIQACEMIKELYRSYDTFVGTSSGGGGGGSTPTTENLTQAIPSTNWLLVDPDCRKFTQTITVPSGLDIYKSSFMIRNSSGEIVNLCTTITSSTTILLETCFAEAYTIVYA